MSPEAIPPALVVFDVGGTTIRDRGEVPAAFRQALAAGGIAADDRQIASWRGASKRSVIEALVAERCGELSDAQRAAKAAALYEGFRTALAGRLREASDLSMPDAAGTFERLQAGGIHVALNSGFDRPIMDLILGAVAWPAGLVDAVVCGDDVDRGRPAPDMIFKSMERTGVTDVRLVAVVGDTRLDLEAGANAGVRYRIGVLTGAHDRATLERAPHTHIVACLGAVLDIVGV